MKSLLIKNGHLIDPAQGIDESGSLLITGDKIAWQGKGETPPPHQNLDAIDARGLIVCPGFVDLHCHLREPGFEEKETIATGTQAAARGGFTTICAMPNTDPPMDNPYVIEWVKAKAAKESPVRVLPIGCITKGRKGQELAEMGEMAAAGVVGFSDDGDPVPDSRLMRLALDYTLYVGLPIIEHSEDKRLSEGGHMNEGAISTQMGIPAMPAAAEEVAVARDLILAKLTGGLLHLTHVSTEDSVDLVRLYKEKGVKVTADVTPWHLTLTEERVNGYNTSAKMKPPFRTAMDVQACIKALKEGVIDFIGTDHAPHAQPDKACEFALAASGCSCFETALGNLLTLVHGGHLSLATLIAKITSEPAKIIGNKHGILGTLATGASADVTIFDPGKEWVVDTKTFASKGKNNPLDGETLKGKVMATISRGKIAYKEEAIKLKKG